MKWVNQPMLNHLNHLKNHRETHIALTVLISLISVWALNLDQLSNNYTTHYFTDFIRSTYLFCLCFMVHVYTNSKRILGLMCFIVFTILMDIAYLYSYDNYYALNGFRVNYTINLTDLFTSYEILCLLFSFKYWIKNAITKSKGSINNRGNLCDFRVHKANTARNKKA